MRTPMEIAQRFKLNNAHVRRLLRFGYLAPDIVEAIVEGRQPRSLTVKRLLKENPCVWPEQRAAFGFHKLKFLYAPQYASSKIQMVLCFDVRLLRFSLNRVPSECAFADDFVFAIASSPKNGINFPRETRIKRKSCLRSPIRDARNSATITNAPHWPERSGS